MCAVELAILNWIQATFRCDVLDAFFPVFTGFANHGELWIVLAICLLVREKSRRTGLCLGAGLLTDFLVCNLTLKPLIGRIRPFVVNASVELLVKAPHDASFPSGHTAVSFAAVGALYAVKSSLWKPAAVMAVLMAFSRLYLYVHWPTDILGGVVVGWLCGVLGARMVQRFTNRKEK